MTLNPKTIGSDALAVKALELMRSKNISQLIVTGDNKYYAELFICMILFGKESFNITKHDYE